MQSQATSARLVWWACAGLIFITWVDVLDLIETVTLLARPGYAEANVVLITAGSLSLAIVKLLVPVVLGLILLLTYHRSWRTFRLVTVILWLAIAPYAAVVAHNLLLLFGH